MKAYIRSIPRRAWFLIVMSVGYLVLVGVFNQFLQFDDAVIAAQLIYVFGMCLPLLFPNIGRRVGLYKAHPKTLKEKAERELLYTEAELSGIRRYVLDIVRFRRSNKK